MKKLIGKGCIVLFIVIFILGILIVASANPLFADKLNLLTDSGGYANFGTLEVESVLSIIDRDEISTKLIIGDSVAAQIFDDEFLSDDYLIATGNQSMTFIWQYIFAQKYLDKHLEATDIYLVITPDSLSSVWNSQLSYQYILMPMVKFGYLNELDANSKKELSDIYGTFFMKKAVIRTIDNSAINRKLFLNSLNKKYDGNEPYIKDSETVSEISNIYITKIYELCSKKQVNMHLICCPAKDTPEIRSNIEELTKDYLLSEIGELFPEFFDGLMYYSSDLFKDDIHFKDNVLTHEFKREIIEKIKENTGEFSGL